MGTNEVGVNRNGTQLFLFEWVGTCSWLENRTIGTGRGHHGVRVRGTMVVKERGTNTNR